MSTYQAVGAVSSTLKQLLTSYLDTPSGVGPVPITVGLPPDDPEVINGPLVNLFLYRVCENATLQSQELPGQGS
ncbi:MAG: Pvc16 family protein, partial [Solirubrobacteraceae bacterium]